LNLSAEMCIAVYEFWWIIMQDKHYTFVVSDIYLPFIQQFLL